MEIGQSVGGKYRVIADLGAGGMGRAVLARSPGGSLVVLKMTLSGDRDDDERLRDEARVGLHLLHPHIVETLDLVEERGHPALVTAYVSGASLFDLRRHGPLPPESVCRIGRQLAEALEAIHSAANEEGRHLGMLHRDVTPGNVMIGHDGRARLIDLGIVQSNDSRAQRTESGAVRGTVRYLAPELFAGARHSVQTDIWALGIVLWEALLGREAVQGTPAAAVGRICTGNIMVLNDGERVDGRVQRAISKLLKKDPAERPATARDASAIFAMIEKDLAGSTDVEAQMAEIVSARVGPPEIDDPSQTLQLANRARAVFVNDKLATTGLSEIVASVLGDLGSAETSKEHTLDPQPLPRISTPPGSPGAHIEHYVKLLATLERPKA